MQQDSISESRIGGTILGRLVPPLELAAEDLYVRLSSGERIRGTHVPSNLGLTGAVDHVLLDALAAFAPAVKTFLTGGGMLLIGAWLQYRSTHVQLQQRRAELDLLRKQQVTAGESFEQLVDLFLRHGKAGDRRAAEARIVQILIEVPDRASVIEDDAGDS